MLTHAQGQAAERHLALLCGLVARKPHHLSPNSLSPSLHTGAYARSTHAHEQAARHQLALLRHHREPTLMSSLMIVVVS